MKEQTRETLEQLQISVEKLEACLEVYYERKIYANRCAANDVLRAIVSQVLDIQEDIQ